MASVGARAINEIIVPILLFIFPAVLLVVIAAIAATFIQSDY